MGFFSLGSEIHRPSSPSAPPLPPYHESGRSPLIVAETTATRTEFATTTTTEATTHSFAFPGWRKRTSTLESSFMHTPMTGLPEDSSHSTPAHSPPSSRDKALPPTPVELLAERPSQSYEQGIIPSSSPTPNYPVSYSPSVLAQAALGLGLPHVMPHISPSIPTSVSQPNTIIAIDLSPRHSTSDTPSPRRSKSSQRIEKTTETLQAERTSTSDTSRRPRVLSFLSSSSTTSPRVSNEEFNTKGKEVSPNLQSLTRKSSFWSRKKQKELQQARPSTAHGDLFRPNVRAEVDLSVLPLPQPRRQKLQARDPVSRSVPERPQTYHPKSSDMVTSPKVSTKVDGSPLSRNSTEGKFFSSGSIRANTTSFSAPQDVEKALTPRIRSQTNPPLLRRLSMNMFSTTPSFFSTSPISSPSSLSQVPPTNFPRTLDRTTPIIIPRPLENEETPETYLKRLMEVVTKVEVTAILASSSEPFYVTALKVFIGRFNFVGDPLDISLRRLLMEVGLPKETQQIDRVIEAFAKRYMECNPNLYISEDHPYILAFSLIMLHTDAFNKSNKRKMTKADYVKNTKISGVSPEILEYFYDNIIFAPFIFIEDQDPLDQSSRHELTEPTRRSLALREGSLSNLQNPSGSLTTKLIKVDPYHMIMNNLLDPLRIPVDRYIPIENPFSYTGTVGSWNEEELLLTFVEARTIEVYPDTNRSSPFFGLVHGEQTSPKSSNLRMTKVGVLHCKDDLIEGGRKATYRKWRSLGVVLTGSQLLFSRDAAWINAILVQTGDSYEPVSILQPEVLKVDELISVKNVVAVYDSSYTKHRNTFRLVLSGGRHLLFKALTEDDMNQWITRINYASAFISAGVRMRMLGMSDRSMQLTGVAVATLHLHDIQNRLQSSHLTVDRWDDDAPAELLGMLSGDEFGVNRPQRSQRKVTLKVVRDEVELEAKNTIEAEKTAEFKNTFEQVKADLAAESWTSMETNLSTSIKSENVMDSSNSKVKSPNSANSEHPRLPPRSQMIQEKVAELDARLKKTEEKLSNELRFVHNVATLAPFQKATRDRLLAAIQAMTRRVMLLRLDIVRTLCHRKVLHDDMVAETRVWTEVKHIALQTAKESLSSRHNPGVPQMTYSFHQQTSPSRGTDVYRRKRPESSICESFHTAIDSGTDWLSSDDLGSTFLGTSGLFDSPRPSRSGSLSSLPFPEIDGNSSRVWKSEPTLISASHVASDSTLKAENEGSDSQHERFYTAQESPAEEAEAWHQTRCAQRVSLVRVPSNIGLLEFGRRLGVGVEKTGGVG